MATIVKEEDVFDASGPKHLTAIDWKNVDHQRAVTASLVQGVYVLEKDRQKKRQGAQAFASHWWSFFHFRLLHMIVDVDFSIFGAIFEFKPQDFNVKMTSIECAPRHVIALRGNMLKKKSMIQDLKLDISLINNGLQRTSRFEIAFEDACHLLATSNGNSNIWLTGHGLGAAIAMLLGKNLAKTGVLLDTYLFNPPFPSLPLECIQDKKLKNGIHMTGSFIRAGLNVVVNGNKQQNNPPNDPIAAFVSSWIPRLFVNEKDATCSEYIGYFENKVNMKGTGVGNVESLANQTSIKGLLSNVFRNESEAFHRLPSARLIVNRGPSPNFEKAHGINQWWKSDLHVDSKLYTY